MDRHKIFKENLNKSRVERKKNECLKYKLDLKNEWIKLENRKVRN